MPIELTDEEREALIDAWFEGEETQQALFDTAQRCLAILYAAPRSVMERVLEARKAEEESRE